MEELYLGKKTKEAKEQVRTLTKDHIKTINTIIMEQNRVKRDKETISSDTKALAEKLGWPQKKLTAVIAMVAKEQEKGGAIQESNEIIEVSSQVLENEV